MGLNSFASIAVDIKRDLSNEVAIFNALRDSPNSKIATWNLDFELLDHKIAKPLAEYNSVTASVTKFWVGRNQLGDEGATILCDTLRESKATKVQELDLQYNSIGPEGAKAVASMADVVTSLTRLDVSYNYSGRSSGML